MAVTHKERWTTMAVAFDTPPEERTLWQHDLTCPGLCDAAELLGMFNPYSIMRFGPGIIWFPYRGRRSWTRKYDYYRATFAGLVAAMTEKEFNQMLRMQR